ncbi:MAG: I78 family peptidase inhibitor [Paracoccus sp. (in: a-proteobacteria)]|uniref:I78 family peptidase inhibitor n=1 Tax=Paracoccus sp. TaxID=267 RepID=UPI0035B45E40
MTRLFMTAALAALGACTMSEPPAPVAPDSSDLCKASQFQGLIGQPGTALKDLQLPAGTRIIGPTQAVTQDYRLSRLNFEIGKDGRIAKISCY